MFCAFYCRASTLRPWIVLCVLLQGKYFEAICTDIDPEERSLVACFPPEAGLDDTCFKVPYDMLILGAALPGKGALRNALCLRVHL